MFNSGPRYFLLICCLILSAFSLDVSARSSDATVTLDGTQREYLEIEKEVMKTLYRQEPYETTCYNREYYNERVCGNETKYRRECNTIPGRNHCYTDYERQCRTVYKEECTTEYDRQCRTVPGEVKCHRLPNGEQRCEKIPPREICDNVPRRVCRQVPRQECTNVPVQRCEWIPPQQQCQDVPYQEYVCKDVQKYRDVPYTCTKHRDVPYEVLDQLVIGRINAELKTSANSDLELDAKFTITNNKNISVNVSNVRTSKNVIVRANKTEKISTSGTTKTIDVNYVLSEETAAMQSVLKDSKVSWVSLNRDKITVAITKEIDFSKLEMDIEITKDGKTYLKNTVPASSFAVSKRNGMTYVATGIIKNGGKELDGVVNKTFKVNLVLRQKLSITNPENVVFENVSNKLKTEVKFNTVVKRD